MPKRMFFIYFFQEQRHLAVVDDGDSRAAQEQSSRWVQGFSSPPWELIFSHLKMDVWNTTFLLGLDGLFSGPFLLLVSGCYLDFGGSESQCNRERDEMSFLRLVPPKIKLGRQNYGFNEGSLYDVYQSPFPSPRPRMAKCKWKASIKHQEELLQLVLEHLARGLVAVFGWSCDGPGIVHAPPTCPRNTA